MTTASIPTTASILTIRPIWARWLPHALAGIVLAMLVTWLVINIAGSDGLLDGIGIIALLAAALAVGWVLAWKLPRNPLGYILLAITAFFTATGPASLLADALLETAPGLATWVYLVFGSEGVDNWTWVPPVWLLLSLLPLRFPTGRLPSPRWRGFQWFSIGALILTCVLMMVTAEFVAPGIANPLHVPALDGVEVIVLPGFVALGVAFVGSIASLFVRYRAAGSLERAQLRWVLWAVAIAVGVLVITWVSLAVIGESVFSALFVISYALIPVAIGFSVLRYRLYEIDRIISRTASYAIVSLVVVGTYLAVVTSATLLLPDLPAVGVALATLAAAALFLPLLRLVRRLVDRRFNREQYDAAQVVDAFGERLRSGVDPHTAAEDLVVAVERTLAPSAIGIWTPERRPAPGSPR